MQAKQLELERKLNTRNDEVKKLQSENQALQSQASKDKEALEQEREILEIKKELSNSVMSPATPGNKIKVLNSDTNNE